MTRRRPRRSTRILFAEHPQVFVVLACFFVVMVVFMAALIDLQAVRPHRYRDLAVDQSTATRKLAGFRGQLLDREGYVLAASTPTQLLIADPQLVADPTWTATLLAPELGIEADVLHDRLLPANDEDRYNVVAATSDQDALAAIRTMVADADTTEAFDGIVIRPEEDRLYPAGDLARPVVGRVDPDEVGRSGVEQQFDELLSGTSGFERYERGIFGSISVGQRIVEPAERGYDITLTLDHRIQFGTEAILIDTCEKLGAMGAAAIVSDPRTGEIYSLASVDRLDDTTCGVASYNKAVVDTFEPGSVMKIVAFAAAADHLGYRAGDMITVPPSIEVADKPFFDHPRHEEQEMSLADALAQSSNVATIGLSQQLGPQRYYEYASAFGFGELTGLDFAGEVAGVLRHPSEWRGSDAGSIVIGQGMTVNLLQLAAAFNAIGNGGRYVQPVIVANVEDADGEDHLISDPVERPVIGPDAAAEMLEMMTAVTGEGGTGFKAAIEGYEVAGKTGTAWKVFDNGSGRLSYGADNDRRYVTTFGGLVPATDPELSVVLMIDEPRTATSATTAAAPTFAQIAQYALRVLKIAPGHAEETPAWRQARTLVRGTPAVAEDARRAADEAASPEADPPTTEPDSTGDDEEVTATTPAAAEPSVVDLDVATDPAEGE